MTKNFSFLPTAWAPKTTVRHLFVSPPPPPFVSSVFSIQLFRGSAQKKSHVSSMLKICQSSSPVRIKGSRTFQSSDSSGSPSAASPQTDLKAIVLQLQNFCSPPWLAKKSLGIRRLFEFLSLFIKLNMFGSCCSKQWHQGIVYVPPFFLLFPATRLAILLKKQVSLVFKILLIFPQTCELIFFPFLCSHPSV